MFKVFLRVTSKTGYASICMDLILLEQLCVTLLIDVCYKHWFLAENSLGNNFQTLPGNPLSLVVHAANVHDTKAGHYPACKAYTAYPTIRVFCGVEGYRRNFVEDDYEHLNFCVDISERITLKFILLKGWVVERTFAWMGHSRRLSRDYEIDVVSSGTMVKISHIHTLLRRL